MDWRIRQAGEGDEDRLALIGAATFLETFAGLLDGDAIVDHCSREHDAGAYGRYLVDSDSAVWLAEAAVGAAPIGYALTAPPALPGSDPEHDLELKRIYTLSRFHGRGVGAALMRLAIEHAVSAGAARLLLGVYKGNARAIAFYRKSGFEQIAERLFKVGDREYEDVVLARPL